MSEPYGQDFVFAGKYLRIIICYKIMLRQLVGSEPAG